jgi:hypothetical protein
MVMLMKSEGTMVGFWVSTGMENFYNYFIKILLFSLILDANG